ncbi:hypothetical protein C8R45DRAFT_931544 [Mycena sanguinolenta]|nr:hypothetical protein C8R45DRAFT_931544 [Mycena sanguinolenta]
MVGHMITSWNRHAGHVRRPAGTPAGYWLTEQMGLWFMSGVDGKESSFQVGKMRESEREFMRPLGVRIRWYLASRILRSGGRMRGSQQSRLMRKRRQANQMLISTDASYSPRIILRALVAVPDREEDLQQRQLLPNKRAHNPIVTVGTTTATHSVLQVGVGTVRDIEIRRMLLSCPHRTCSTPFCGVRASSLLSGSLSQPPIESAARGLCGCCPGRRRALRANGRFKPPGVSRRPAACSGGLTIQHDSIKGRVQMAAGVIVEGSFYEARVANYGAIWIYTEFDIHPTYTCPQQHHADNTYNEHGQVHSTGPRNERHTYLAHPAPQRALHGWFTHEAEMSARRQKTRSATTWGFAHVWARRHYLFIARATQGHAWLEVVHWYNFGPADMRRDYAGHRVLVVFED